MIDLAPLFGPKDAAETSEVAFRVFPAKGPARWMLEARYRKPWHLRTWPRANLRAKVIYRAAWALSVIGVHLPSRAQSLPVAAGSVYDALRNQFDDLGIFLGTPGPNRKIVIFAQNAAQSVFVKIPLAPASEALARTETQALTELADDPDLGPLVPKCSVIAGQLAVENIETGGAGYGALSNDEAARIHGLLLDRSAFTKPMHELRADWSAPATDAPIAEQPETTQKLIEQTRQAAEAYLNSFDPSTEVTCYMAHGDFTQWNVLRARDGSARIIDWELYGAKPRGFDLLHYTVSQALLVERATPQAILDRLKTLRAPLPGYLPEGAAGLNDIGFYFACQALFYCNVFERQSALHMQAFWQLETWRDSLLSLAPPQGAASAVVPEVQAS